MPSATFKFYINHSKQQLLRHKCNSCLGICSIFIVVIISALCYTLIEDTPVIFYRQSEQLYGQYDLIVKPLYAPFLNYSLVSSLLQNDKQLQYHSPRIQWNETQSIIYPPSCYTLFNNQSSSDSDDTLCDINKITNAAIWLIDFAKEKHMALGRSFKDSNIPKDNQVILSTSTADKLGVDALAQTVYISLPLNSLHIPLFINYLNDTYFNDISLDAPQLLQLINEYNVVLIPLNVSYISTKSLDGKFAERSHNHFDAVINIEYFMKMFFENLATPLKRALSDLNDNGSIKYDNKTIYEYVTKIYMNLPPNRITPYMSTDYQSILSTLTHWAGQIRYRIGWNEVEMSLDILSSMANVSYTVLSLSIVLDMIIFVLIILSVCLLYSLLVISVDSKKFMLGILRMLGMTKQSIVSLLISQSLGYSIPAYISGIVCAQIGVIYFSRLLASGGNVTLDTKLSNNAIIIATTVGIGCSLIAAILPILSAIQHNLRDVLDIRHSATKAVKFSINRSNTFAVFSCNAITICTVLVSFGWFIYYFLPQSFLSDDLAKVAMMLFSLMLAMLFGFVLIGINTQHLIERIVVKILLVWEKTPIPNIVIKHLIAHRIRNRKTSLMYSLSLSFIFLVTVMLYSNIQFMKTYELRQRGSKLQCEIRRTHNTEDVYKALDDFMSGIDDEYIEGFAWRYGMTKYMTNINGKNIGRYFGKRVMSYPVAPNFEAVSQQEFVERVCGYCTTLTGTELLYTAMGSQRAMLGNSLAEFLKLKTLDDKFLLQYTYQDLDLYVMFLPLGWYSFYPHYYLFNRLIPSSISGFAGDVLISISSSLRVFDGVESVEDMLLQTMFIKLKPSVVGSEIKIVKDRLNPFCSRLWDYNEYAKQIQDSVCMLDVIFSVNTYMALFLCLFSLIASMTTNIMDQTKEIGILRSLGLTKLEINKVYVYEALVLIVSSSFIGISVGSVLSFAMLQQQQLLTNYPIQFCVPQSVIGACITGSILTSILSVWFPLKNVNTKQIAQNLREIL